MTKPSENNGYHADLAETIDYEKLDNILDAWVDKNEFLTKYDAFRTNRFPLKSKQEVYYGTRKNNLRTGISLPIFR